MRKVLFCAVLAVVTASLVSACTPRRQAADDRSHAQQRLSMSSVDGVEKTSINTALRIFNDYGYVGVCGGLIVAGQDAGVNQVRQRFLHPDTKLLIGDQIAISPWFMKQMFHPASEMTDGKVQFKLGAIPETCTRLENPWDPALAKAKFKLSFAK